MDFAKTITGMMMGSSNLNEAQSLWEAVSPPRDGAASLEGDVSADVVIVGGGLAGLSSALHLAKRGRKVVVLEGKTIGWGASGRNNGQVIPVLSGAEPEAIEQRYGAVGERLVALIRDSADTLFQLARDEGIECEAEQNGWFQPAHTAGHMQVSEWRNAAWAKRGAPCRMLDHAQSTALLGSDKWFGGMLNPTGGHINPLMFVRGLAKACERAGVLIFENTPALKVERKLDRWLVRTSRGQVKSDAVLLATNAYSDALTKDLMPKMARSVVPVMSFQMSTQPLDDALREDIIPGREAISDTRGDLQFFRHDARNRLVSGGALIWKGNVKQRLQELVGDRLARAFPALGVPRFSHVWSGYIGVTVDHFPHFHRLGPNYWGWSGCNGRGVALTVSVGRELAAAIDGDEDVALPFAPPVPIPFHSIVRRIAPNMLAYYRWRDRQVPKL